MKIKIIYQCEFCLTEYKTSEEAFKCEADCLKLTLEEYAEYRELLSEEKAAFAQAPQLKGKYQNPNLISCEQFADDLYKLYMGKNNMKPEIGTKVYCIYNECILIKHVAFLGDESFIIDSFCDGLTYQDSWEWYYEDYETEWFTDLEKVKEELMSIITERYNEDNFKIVKSYTDYYGVEWGEEE